MDRQGIKKWLARQGCIFEGKRGGSGHLCVLNPKTADAPSCRCTPGGSLGTGLMKTIKRQLGLEDR